MKYNKDTIIFITGIISYIILIIALFKKKYKIIFFYFLIFGLFFLFFQNFAFILAFLFLIIIIIISYLNIKEATGGIEESVGDSVRTRAEEVSGGEDQNEDDITECQKDVSRRVTEEIEPEYDTSQQDTSSEEIKAELNGLFDDLQSLDPSDFLNNGYFP